jgi:hypothetical protein
MVIAYRGKVELRCHDLIHKDAPGRYSTIVERIASNRARNSTRLLRKG